jgi:uncharacterized protein (TIGR02217 family)
MAFHEVRFPLDISRGANGGPERRTDIVTLGSGAEERNARWANSRRSWNAGYGAHTLDQLHAIVSFFEERRGRLHGFRWRDAADWKSCAPQAPPSRMDQTIGTGDGVTASFQLIKLYGGAFAPWTRTITKPVLGTVVVAVGGVAKVLGTQFIVNGTTGSITFLSGHSPALGQAVTAGFEFDCPVRFDTDKLEISVQGFRHGAIPNIPIIEVRT